MTTDPHNHDPAAPARRPNRLAGETSPYLLQHAHNPVDWHPWGEEAFAKARSEGKPLLVSIGYSACHWCHVMERESFENPAIAELITTPMVAGTTILKEFRKKVAKLLLPKPFQPVA